MSDRTPHIVGVGNALVDVVTSVQPAVIDRHGLTVAGMHLVEADAARALFDEVGPGVRQSGGSVANSIAHLADLGLQGTYIGKIAGDELGATFRDEMDAMGIATPVPAGEGEPGTGRCVVLVTPDGERTMSTYLGAAQTLAPSEVGDAHPEACDILFVEGYLWDSPKGAAVIETAAAKAAACGARIALTPSDPGCVERNRDAMQGFIARHADILVGNSEEIGALAGQDDPELALEWAASRVETAAVTLSEDGALLAACGGTRRIAAQPVPRVVDSTGAGDAFASGFLGGLALGRGLEEAGHMGARLAASVLGHFGARDGAAARALALPAA